MPSNGDRWRGNPRGLPCLFRRIQARRLRPRDKGKPPWHRQIRRPAFTTIIEAISPLGGMPKKSRPVFREGHSMPAASPNCFHGGHSLGYRNVYFIPCKKDL